MKHTTDQAIPRARDNGLLVRELEDELLVYDLDRHKAHCLNKTAASIWRHCDGKKTVTQIASSLSDESGSLIDEEVVWLGLTGLERTHLLNERITRAPGAKAYTRREVMRRIGIAAAVGLPLVTSVLAPRASEAATCVASGGSCNPGTCCSPCTCSGSPGLCVGC
jgi:hypothetical protein